MNIKNIVDYNALSEEKKEAVEVAYKVLPKIVRAERFNIPVTIQRNGRSVNYIVGFEGESDYWIMVKVQKID